MKKWLYFLFAFCEFTANAQNYSIGFAGIGSCNSVEKVIVENLATGSSLTLDGGDILYLKGLTTNVDQIKVESSPGLRIYPNPMIDNSTIEISPAVPGNAIISVYDITGKLLTQTKYYLENSIQEFKLTGSINGICIIHVKGRSYELSGELLCFGNLNERINIQKVNNFSQVKKEDLFKRSSKYVQSVIEMEYNSGDKLKFTGKCGVYCTTLTEIPVADKTVIFNFIPCLDGENYNYPIVEIGTQFWMAENLKTTRYCNTDLIETTNPITLDISSEIAPKYQWAPDDVATYGKLYTWYAINDNRRVCPIDWHLPSDVEWTILIDYLGGINIAGGKMRETGTTHWVAPNTGATNESGFSALPNGERSQSGQTQLQHNMGIWWSSEIFETWARFLSVPSPGSYVIKDRDPKTFGLAVRCIKD